MKFYVATSLYEADEARQVIDRLVDMGHEVTHDWTRTDEFEIDNGLVYLARADFTDEEYAKFGADDIQGVRDADVTILLDGKPRYMALIEAGIAIGAGKEVWVVNPQRSHKVAWAQPQVAVLEDNRALFDLAEDVARSEKEDELFLQELHGNI